MAELTPKVISELPDRSVPQDADLFAISRSGESRKISWETLKSGLPRLGRLNATQGQAEGGTATVFDIDTYGKGVLIVTSAATSKQDIIIYYGRAGSSVAFTRLTNASDLAVSSGQNTLSITPSSGAAAYYLNLQWK